MTSQEYQIQLSAYQKAISRRKSLEMTIRMNKAQVGCFSFKRHPERAGKIEQTQQQLAALIVPPKPERVIEGFEVYDQAGDFDGFIRTQSETEAHEQARLYHEKYTLKSVYTN